MISELTELSACGHKWAEDRAKMALTIIEAYNGGHIPKTQLNQLLTGLIEPVRLNSESDNDTIKQRLTNCILGGVNS